MTMYKQLCMTTKTGEQYFIIYTEEFFGPEGLSFNSKGKYYEPNISIKEFIKRYIDYVCKIVTPYYLFWLKQEKKKLNYDEILYIEELGFSSPCHKYIEY